MSQPLAAAAAENCLADLAGVPAAAAFGVPAVPSVSEASGRPPVVASGDLGTGIARGAAALAAGAAADA